jgi:predicted Zn-ribbon and HTH transcriptional regulator
MWSIVMLTAAVVCAWLSARHKRSPDRCIKCGYDLRATPERCPECGTVA